MHLQEAFAPKPMRKFVKMSAKQLLKKGDNHKAQEKATRHGLNPEVREFVTQLLLEWQVKLSADNTPRAIMREMIQVCTFFLLLPYRLKCKV